VPVDISGGELRETGAEVRYDVELLLLAIGFVGAEVDPLVEQLGVTIDARGNIGDENYATSVNGVFTAGDARRGQSLIVWALMEGREAARSVDAYLRGAESQLPTRGRDNPY
jgi:glutamate synthase (NADPH/NADH) small chain